jgi:hypothetical protein
MVATVVVVMVVVTSFASVFVNVVKAEKQTVVRQLNVPNAQVGVQTATVVVVLLSLRKLLLQKLLLQKLLLKRPRRIRRRKLLQLQQKPNLGFIQHV